LPIHKHILFAYLDLPFIPKSGRLEKTHQTLNIMVTLEQTLKTSHDWALDRIHYLSQDNIEDAHAIQSEFSEWLDPDIPEHDIFSLEYIGE
jgi:hypothetical protein